jgi:glutamate racemase
MLILFDQGTPRGIVRALSEHTVKEARAMRWDKLTNGELLKAAEQAGFDVLLTTDKNLQYQQNLKERKIAIVVLGKSRWKLIRPVIPNIVAAVNKAQPGTYTEVDIPG